MSKSTDISFKRYKLQNHFANACLMTATASVSIACGYVFQKTTGLYPDVVSPVISSVFPLVVGGGIAALATADVMPNIGWSDDENVKKEDREALDKILDKAGYTKPVIMTQIDDPREGIAKAYYGNGEIRINQAQYGLLDGYGKRRSLGHEASHFINNDSAFKNLNILAGKGASGVLTSLSILTLNPLSAAFAATCMVAQHYLDKKLSRNVECRAEIEGAYLDDQTPKQVRDSMEAYDQKHLEVYGEKPLDDPQITSLYPSREQVAKAAVRALAA